MFRTWLVIFALVLVCATGTLNVRGLTKSIATVKQNMTGPGVRIIGSDKLMPSLGFGTCCRASAKGQPLIDSTKIYLSLGGRLLDTAQRYGNHRDLKVAIAESGVPRDDLWVTSKLNTRSLVFDEIGAVKAVRDSLAELGLEYLDLMLIHGAWENDDQKREAVWRGLISAKKEGKVRNIGVSNYNRDQIEKLEKATGVRPAVNQIEYHPWVPQETKDLFKWCKDNSIAVTAYGSLGGSANKAEDNVVLAAAAKKYATNKSQILLRWALDQGAAVIPGATSKAHIHDNLFLNKFHLDSEDLTTIESSQKPDTFRRWKNCKSGCAN